MADTTNNINYIKLAQFETVISENKLDNEKMVLVIERLIDQGLNVNYKLKPIDTFKFKSNYPGSTALHLALDYGELDIFSSLLKHGADFTIKDDEGKPVIHQALDKSFHRKEACWLLQGQLKHQFIDAVLEKQICSKNSATPSSKDRLSHFHAACMTNNAKAVKFILKNRALVNEAIDLNSKSLPGYTPLQLAVRYWASEVAKLLLDCDVDLNEKMVLVIKRLIDQGLNVNYKLKPIDTFKFKSNYPGSTALHLALDYLITNSINLLIRVHM